MALRPGGSDVAGIVIFESDWGRTRESVGIVAEVVIFIVIGVVMLSGFVEISNLCPLGPGLLRTLINIVMLVIFGVYMSYITCLHASW